MAKLIKKIADEREYIINLRREIMKVPKYKRTPKAIKALKQFIAKHMHILERDISKVKIDKYLNEYLWFRGIKNPITKIKVKAKRDGENIFVELSELPEKLRFIKAREDKIKAEAEKTKEKKAEEKAKEEKKTEDKTAPEEFEEKKKEEEEKEKATDEAKEELAEIQAKQQKHIADIQKIKKTMTFRKALKK